MFNKQNFCHVASNNRNEQKAGLFVYKTTDNLATVSVSGYFNEKIIDINLHDLIIHEWHDPIDRTKVQRNVLCVIERTLDNVGTKIIKTNWEENIDTLIEQIQTDLSGKVNIDGSSIMTGPLKMRSSISFKCAIAPSWDGVGFYKLNDNDSVTLLASMEAIDGLTPAQNNTYNIGKATHKWKTLYIGALNNGYNIAVPVTAQADTLALKSEVDLAANSGRMITEQGVWYAKMDAAGTIPAEAEVEGRNYADFTQVDVDNNPIIVIYTYTSGAWTQTETITPPAAYDGYVPVTSKIWDIPEQTGQQGGRILWNHQSKEFTPYPMIVSFDNQNITNSSLSGCTTTMSGMPGTNDITNAGYVQSLIAASQGYDLFDFKWRDSTTSNPAWALSDGNWKQNATAYQHLVDDIGPQAYGWLSANDTRCYTTSEQPEVGDDVYQESGSGIPSTPVGTITAVAADYSSITFGGAQFNRQSIYDTYFDQQSETVAATTIYYFRASDGHKIILPSQETNADAIYAATGVAWYYVLDKTNEQFKLPRTTFAFVGSRGDVGDYVAPEVPNITFGASGLVRNGSGALTTGSNTGNYFGPASSNNMYEKSLSFSAANSSSVYKNDATVQQPATQMYLYFYIGI